MARRSFLILHGLHGSGPGHWQPWLVAQLARAGERVAFPQLPAPSAPSPDAWMAALEAELAAMEGERIVACHSLACLLWLRYADAGAPAGRAARVLLNAPPCAGAGLAELEPFLAGLDATGPGGTAADEALLLCSDADPYCPEGAGRVWAQPRGIPSAVLAGAGHINSDAGYGPWPWVLRWCLEGSAAGPPYGAKNGVDT